MPTPKSLCAVLIVLAFAACAKKGASPEPATPEGLPSAQEPMGTTPSEPSASEETSMSPGQYEGEGTAAPMGPEMGATPAPEATGAAQAESLTDAQILKITEAVNSGEIEQAKLARTKARSSAVKQFASHMISAHSKAKQKGETLARKEALAPEDSPDAADVSAQGTATLETLKAKGPADFDKAYIDAQVEQHQTVLNMITGKLLPSASDESIKRQLEESQKMVEEHLAEARRLQQEL